MVTYVREKRRRRSQLCMEERDAMVDLILDDAVNSNSQQKLVSHAQYHC